MIEGDKFDRSWILSAPVTQMWVKQKEPRRTAIRPFSPHPLWAASMEAKGEAGSGKGTVVKAVALATVWLDSFSVPAWESHLGDFCGTVPFCI